MGVKRRITAPAIGLFLVVLCGCRPNEGTTQSGPGTHEKDLEAKNTQTAPTINPFGLEKEDNFLSGMKDSDCSRQETSAGIVYSYRKNKSVLLEIDLAPQSSAAVFKVTENGKEKIVDPEKVIGADRILNVNALGLLRYDMPFEDIERIIGRHRADVGSGVAIYAWKLAGNCELRINRMFLETESKAEGVLPDTKSMAFWFVDKNGTELKWEIKPLSAPGRENSEPRGETENQTK